MIDVDHKILIIKNLYTSVFRPCVSVCICVCAGHVGRTVTNNNALVIELQALVLYCQLSLFLLLNSCNNISSCYSYYS
jgi:hypothetical protein